MQRKDYALAETMRNFARIPQRSLMADLQYWLGESFSSVSYRDAAESFSRDHQIR
jgi:TolA-binding protein